MSILVGVKTKEKVKNSRCNVIGKDNLKEILVFDRDNRKVQKIKDFTLLEGIENIRDGGHYIKGTQGKLANYLSSTPHLVLLQKIGSRVYKVCDGTGRVLNMQTKNIINTDKVLSNARIISGNVCAIRGSIFGN